MEAMNSKRYYEAGFIIDESLNSLYDAINGTGSNDMLNMLLMRKQVPIEKGKKYDYLKWVESELLQLREKLGDKPYICDHQWRLRNYKSGFGTWYYVVCDNCHSDVIMGDDCPFTDYEFKKLRTKYGNNFHVTYLREIIPKTMEYENKI